MSPSASQSAQPDRPVRRRRLLRNLPRGSFVTDDDLTDEMGLGEAALVHSMRRVAGIRVR